MSVSIENNLLVQWYSRTPDRERRRMGLSMLAVCFIVLLFRSFLNEHGIVKTGLQVEFERYVEVRERAALTGGDAELVAPRFHVIIKGSDIVQGRELLIDPGTDDEGNAKILRLLTLTREAKVFALKQADAASDNTISVRVEDGISEFSTSFYREDIRNNIQAEVLLKLLTIHGRPVV